MTHWYIPQWLYALGLVYLIGGLLWAIICSNGKTMTWRGIILSTCFWPLLMVALVAVVILGD